MDLTAEHPTAGRQDSGAATALDRRPRDASVPRGVRLVALLEAAKAILVLLAGFGILGLVHRDLSAFASHLITRLHLNPANKYPRIFIDAASRVTDAHLWLLAALAMIYAMFRAAEAYGLWQNRRWAAGLALVTGGIYLPFEVYELTRAVTWVRVGALIINILVVVYMAYDIRRRSHGQRTTRKARL